MTDCHEEAFEWVATAVNTSYRALRYAKPGFCRDWTLVAIAAIQAMMDAMDAKDYSVSTEAREVHLEPGLSHTFIQVTIVCKGESELYILDGTGTAKFDRYAGLASNAPPHLKNSHIDLIQRYIDSI